MGYPSGKDRATTELVDINMSNEILSNIEIVHLPEPLTAKDVLSRLAAVVLNKGWAKPGYFEALWEREVKYPTGLHTPGVEIAIPHADPEWTTVPAMVIGVLEKPAAFDPMGGQGDAVQASFVFLLVIPDANAHISFLQALSSFIEDEAQLRRLDVTRDVSLLINHLQKELVS